MKMARFFKRGSLWVLVVSIFMVFSFLAAVASAKTAKEINREANAALKLFEKQVPGGKGFLKAAKGVLVIPNLEKVGVGPVGGEYGQGALRIGHKTVDYYSLTGGSFGFTFGAEKVHLILLFMQEQAFTKFRASTGWETGVDGTVTFIDKGKEKALTTETIKDPIVGFFFGEKGLMADVSVEGAKFTKIKR
jgi:lipid-binding SYLF domain-containing protein